MSISVPARTLPGAVKPPVDGGGTSYYVKNTKVSQITNPKVNPVYANPVYKTLPPHLGERSGQISTVIGKPDDVKRGYSIQDEVFPPGNPEMEQLTEYYSRVVPAQNNSVEAAYTIKKYGLSELLERFLSSKLQDDVDTLKSRYAGATDVERQLAFSKLQNRYSDMVRHYGGEQRLRDALLREYIGGIEDPAVRGALQRENRFASAAFGSSTVALAPDEVAVPGAAEGEADRSAYYDGVNAMPMTEMESEARAEDEREIEQPTSVIKELQEEIERLREAERELMVLMSGREAKTPGYKRKYDGRELTFAQLRKERDLVLGEIRAATRSLEREQSKYAVVSSRTLTETVAETAAAAAAPTAPSHPIPQVELSTSTGDGMDVLDGGASRPDFTVGTSAPHHTRVVGVRGAIGESRSLREHIPTLPAAASARALADQDEGAAQSYRERPSISAAAASLERAVFGRDDMVRAERLADELIASSQTVRPMGGVPQPPPGARRRGRPPKPRS
jgi:hypothetical protein